MTGRGGGVEIIKMYTIGDDSTKIYYGMGGGIKILLKYIMVKYNIN